MNPCPLNCLGFPLAIITRIILDLWLRLDPRSRGKNAPSSPAGERLPRMHARPTDLPKVSPETRPQQNTARRSSNDADETLTHLLGTSSCRGRARGSTSGTPLARGSPPRATPRTLDPIPRRLPRRGRPRWGDHPRPDTYRTPV